MIRGGGFRVKVLDGIFHLAGVLSAVLLAAIALLTFIQIVGRTLGYLVSTGTEFAGFCMAASIFLALAWTLRSGGHIRVGLVLQALPPGPRRLVEIWCLSGAVFAIGLFAWSATMMTWDSYRFGDVSVGLVPVPLWIPQIAMALGIILMEIALIEQLVLVLSGREPTYRAFEDTESRVARGEEPGA
ncbi:TRAP transporter small permease [Pikeienuella piscinae]|uniref:TRAP transporter small permease protein n=1 Tax=Pikeienuella piscinae TaxID=2748098 RepID=A0A7L5C2J5_9RHOB|nr:TRAP transporter small permease [Pikeienuella piscinae]QIE56766.1 TRAP transporter small permease [Pikeienuella piscinae]